MDISKAVTVPHKMKRGNYAVNASDIAWLSAAVGNASTSTLTETNTVEEVVSDSRQGTTSGVRSESSHQQQTRGSVREEDCVQREPIQRRLLQQEFRSSRYMAIALGKTKVVITETNTRSTQVCATSL